MADLTERTMISEIVKPDDLAAALGCSPRRIREMARHIGACRLFGKTMVLLPDDVAAILEAARPRPLASTAWPTTRTTAAPLPEGDFAELLKLRERQERRATKSKRRAVSKSGGGGRKG